MNKTSVYQGKILKGEPSVETEVHLNDPVILSVCQNCSSTGLAKLQTAIDGAFSPSRVQIVKQGCMNSCARPVSLAFQAKGRATYFFNGLDLQTDTADIITTLRAYIEAPQGWIVDARCCGRLRFCLVGRVPSL